MQTDRKLLYKFHKLVLLVQNLDKITAETSYREQIPYANS